MKNEQRRCNIPVVVSVKPRLQTEKKAEKKQTADLVTASVGM